MQASSSPVLANDATEEKGSDARLSVFLGAIAIGDSVKTTLGPKGMDKMLQSATQSTVLTTNDGATILQSLAIDNPGAKILIDLSKTQDKEIGDGTTSVCVLATELIREAESLITLDKMHPQTVIEGYQAACAVAVQTLEQQSFSIADDKETLRSFLLKMANTVLGSKILAAEADLFAALSVDAVLRLNGSRELDRIQILKKLGAKLGDSYLADGLILPKSIGVNQPKKIENARILVANTSMDADKVKVFGASVKADSIEKLAQLERAEKDKMHSKVDKIKAHSINCFVNRQLIYNWPEQLFADAQIMAIENADFAGIERLALVTGGQIASTFDTPELTALGSCALVEEIEIGEQKMVRFSGCACEGASTIVLRGATEQMLEEAERSVHDVLCVLVRAVHEHRAVYGGGCTEICMAAEIERKAATTGGKKMLAMNAYAKALRKLPKTIADNGSYDGAELVARLIKEESTGNTTFGLDMQNADVADMRILGVVESYSAKRNIVMTATEAADMIVRVDGVERAAPRKRDDHRH